MKKLEKGVFISSLICLVVKTLHVPGGAFLALISIATLSIFYYVFSFYLVNNKTWKDIFIWSTYKSSGVLNTLLCFACGVGLNVAILSLLFQLMKWEKALLMSIASLFSIAFLSMIVGVTFFFKKTEWKKQLIYRLVFYGLLNLIMFFLGPRDF